MKNLILITVALLYWGKPCGADDGNIAPNPETATAAINLERAANQLIKDEHNRILGAETEQMDDKTIHIIKVLTEQGHVRHFKFDAETGEQIN